MLDCAVSSDQVKRVERRSEHSCGGAKPLVACMTYITTSLISYNYNQMLCTGTKESASPHLLIHATGYLPLHPPLRYKT